MPASAMSGLDGGYSPFNVAGFRGARGGRQDRLGAQGSGGVIPGGGTTAEGRLAAAAKASRRRGGVDVDERPGVGS